jgi:hypothetical protein
MDYKIVRANNKESLEQKISELLKEGWRVKGAKHSKSYGDEDYTFYQPMIKDQEGTPKVYVTGDTHGTHDIQKLLTFSKGKGKDLTKNDYVIILGDTGILWGKDRKHNAKMKRIFENFPWTTLIVDGNHDDHDQLQNLLMMPMFNDVVGEMFEDSVYHLKRGIVYHINGKKFWVMGGALSVDREYRTEGVNWWAGELLSKADEDKGFVYLDVWDDKVDYILTHTCPSSHATKIKDAANWRHKQTDPTSKYLQKVFDSTEFDKWYCGHWHIDQELDGINFLYKDIVEIK